MRTSLYIWFWGLIGWTMVLVAGIPGRAAVALPRDTGSVIDARVFSAEKMNGYRQAAKFQYVQPEAPARGLWFRIKYWIARILEQLFDNATGTVTGRIVAGLLLIGIIIYLATRMAGFHIRAPLQSGQSSGASVFVTEDDIHSLDFEAAITGAVGVGNLRLAVRLWYLRTLQQLSDKGIVDWKPGKTNYAYLAELRSTRYAMEFDGLTTDFEICWYGDTPVEVARYHALERRFRRFNQQIMDS